MRVNHQKSDQEICPLAPVPMSMRNTLTFTEAWSEVLSVPSRRTSCMLKFELAVFPIRG
jgi:hypothetical protein